MPLHQYEKNLVACCIVELDFYSTNESVCFCNTDMHVLQYFVGMNIIITGVSLSSFNCHMMSSLPITPGHYEDVGPGRSRQHRVEGRKGRCSSQHPKTPDGVIATGTYILKHQMV